MEGCNADGGALESTPCGVFSTTLCPGEGAVNAVFEVRGVRGIRIEHVAREAIGKDGGAVEELLRSVKGEIDRDSEFLDEGQSRDGVEADIFRVAAGEKAGTVGGVCYGGE